MSSRSCLRSSRVRNVAVRLLALSVAVSAVVAASADTYVWTAGLNNSSNDWYSGNWLQNGVNTGNSPYVDDVYLNNSSDFVYTDYSDSFAWANTLTNYGTLSVQDGGVLYTSTDTAINGFTATLGVSGSFVDGAGTYLSTAYLDIYGGTLSVDGGNLLATNHGQIFSYADNVVNQGQGWILAIGQNSVISIGGYDPYTGGTAYGNVVNTGGNTRLGAQAGGAAIISAASVDNGNGASLFADGEDAVSAGVDSFLSVTATNVYNHDNGILSATAGGQVGVSADGFYNYQAGQVLSSSSDSLGQASYLTVSANNLYNDNALIQASQGGQIGLFSTYTQNSTGGSIVSTDAGSSVSLTSNSFANLGNSYVEALSGGTVNLAAYAAGSGNIVNDSSTMLSQSGGQLTVGTDLLQNQNNGHIVASSGGYASLSAGDIVNDNSFMFSDGDNAFMVAAASNSIVNQNIGLMGAYNGGTLDVVASSLLNDSNSSIISEGLGAAGAPSTVNLDVVYLSNTNGSTIGAGDGATISLSPNVQQFYNDSTSVVESFAGGSIYAGNYLAENAGSIQSDGSGSVIQFNLTSMTGGMNDHGTFYNDPSGTLLATNGAFVAIAAQQTYNYGSVTALSGGQVGLVGNFQNPGTSYVENDGSVTAQTGGVVDLGYGLGDSVVNNGSVTITDGSFGVAHGYAGGGTTVNNGQIYAQGTNALFNDYADTHIVGANGVTAALYGGVVNLENSASGMGTNVVNYGAMGAQDGGAAVSNGYATTMNINTVSKLGSTDNHGFYGALQGGVVNDSSKTWHNAPEGVVQIDSASSMNLKTGGLDYNSNWNQGTIQVTNGSALNVTTVARVSTNSGTLYIDATSTAAYSGYYLQTNYYDGQNGTTIVKGTLSAAVVQLGFGGPGTGGTLTGNGTVNGFLANVSGLVKPGDATSLFVTQSFKQYSDGILEMSIEGLAGAGVAGGNDVLLVGQNTTLDGTLNLDFAPGYTASVGDTFYVLLTGGGVNGAFASVNSLGLTPGYFAQAVYDPSDVRIQIAAVPEPTTLAVMGLGLLALARRRRKSA